MPSIKGTASVADARERSKALKSTRFPANFSTKIKLDKVNKPVLTQWIERKLTSILGFDDEIVSSMAINLFLPSDGSNPDPRRAQLDLVGFLGEVESAAFAKELWTLLVEAQESASGIPQTLLEAKKKELSQQKSRMQQPLRGRDNIAALQGNNNPDMNRFVQEANRRAAAARHMLPPGPEAVGDGGPVPIPVSPQHPSDHPPPDDRGQPSRYSRTRKGGSQESDRKMPARRGNSSTRYDRPGRYPPAHAPPPPPYRDDDGYGPPPPPPPPHGGSRRGMGDGGRGSRRSSRDRSRSMEYVAGGGRYGSPPAPGEDEFRRTTDWRRHDPPPPLPPPPAPLPPGPPVGPPRRPDDRWQRGSSGGRGRRRYYSEEEEVDDLERRLAMLKPRVIKRGDDYALDDEIEDIEDRLYDIDRRRRRRRREEEEEEYRRRNRRDPRHRPRSRSRSRSLEAAARRPPPGGPPPPLPPRRSPGPVPADRRRRGDSSESDDSRRRRRRRSPSTDSTGSSRSRSSTSGDSSASVSSRSSKESHDDRRRRRSRSASSGSSSSEYSKDSRR